MQPLLAMMRRLLAATQPFWAAPVGHVVAQPDFLSAGQVRDECKVSAGQGLSLREFWSRGPRLRACVTTQSYN